MAQELTIGDAIAQSFAVLSEVYGSKFKPGEGTAAAWAFVLDDVRPAELLEAVRAWLKSAHEWPPTPGEIRAAIPRFCRCGRCRACNARALERARMAVARGSLGAQDFEPERAAEAPTPPPKRLGGRQ